MPAPRSAWSDDEVQALRELASSNEIMKEIISRFCESGAGMADAAGLDCVGRRFVRLSAFGAVCAVR